MRLKEYVKTFFEMPRANPKEFQDRILCMSTPNDVNSFENGKEEESCIRTAMVIAQYVGQCPPDKSSSCGPRQEQC